MSAEIEIDETSTTMASVISRAIDASIAAIHTCMPARIEAVDPDHQRVDVKPLIKRVRRLDDGTRTELALPVISHVPVQYPRGGGWRMTWPLAVGDIVLLVFSERSLDTFLTTGAEDIPSDTRKHDLTDAIAIPGLAPFTNPIPGIGSTDMVVGREDGTCELRMKPTGEILLSAGGEASEPMVLGSKLVQWLAAHTHTSPVGPTSPPNPPDQATLSTLLSPMAKVI